MALEQETAFFDANRAKWIADGHGGKWATVHLGELVGFFPSLDEGYKAGADRFPGKPFLVKQVTPSDKVETIHRAFWGQVGTRTAV